MDQAVLFSSDDMYGTARFTGMGGAFGAVGGDISAVDINPAGLAVFNNTDFTSSLSYRDTKINTTFYNNAVSTKDDYFRFSQIGGVLAVNNYGNTGFKKFTFGFNYNVIKDFNNDFLASGNSGIPTYVDDPFLNYDGDDSNNVYYTNVDDQRFRNYSSGINDKFTMSFATQYEEFLYLGMTFSFQHINYYQSTQYEEYNNDGNGNTLDAYLNEELSTYGNGFNFGLGAIVKPLQNLRLGLSYQSPIWYNLSENSIQYTDPDTGEMYAGDLEIYVSNNTDSYSEYGERNYYDYSLKTPGKFTGSAAYIFGKSGLISFDYIFQDYTNINLSPSSSFTQENEDIRSQLKNTSSFRLGTEWRIHNFSLRGGYSIMGSPYKNANSDEDISGYSLGLGIQFNQFFKLDFAFDNSSHSTTYQFVGNHEVTPAQLDFNNNRFTSTLVFNF
jgi:hypothetical protein